MAKLTVEEEKTIYITGTLQEIDAIFRKICSIHGVSTKSVRKDDIS